MDSKIVAYHESAHAVMCLSHGIRFKKVTIIPEGDYRGQVDTRGHRINGLWEFVGAMEALMAGAIAHAQIKGEPMTLDKITVSDRKEITRLLKENQKLISMAESAEFMAWIFKRTQRHLAQRWKAVERMAAALQATRTLTYDECKTLME